MSNDVELYCGDCYEKIKDIPDNSVDLVVIDPPYLYTTGGGGGAFGSKKRSYHAEVDSVSQHTPLDDRKRRSREEIRVISSGFNYGLFDELCRTLKKVNIYVWCSKMQVSSILNYFEKKGCPIDILTWHKTNPTPTMNNTYANDTEYLIFAREKGVRVNGTYHTKRKYYVTPTNVKDKRLYGHPTCKPQEIIENLITNSSERGGLYWIALWGLELLERLQRSLGASLSASN